MGSKGTPKEQYMNQAEFLTITSALHKLNIKRHYIFSHTTEEHDKAIEWIKPLKGTGYKLAGEEPEDKMVQVKINYAGIEIIYIDLEATQKQPTQPAPPLGG